MTSQPTNPTGPKRPGRWVAIDLELFADAKIMRLSPLQVCAYLGCIFYASRHLTDGHIPKRKAGAIAEDVGADRRVFAKLVEAGLLKPASDGGWHIARYLDWQPSRGYLEHQAKRNREKVKAWRERQVTSGLTGYVPGEEVEVDLLGEARPSTTDQRDPSDGLAAASERPETPSPSPDRVPSVGRVSVSPVASRDQPVETISADVARWGEKLRAAAERLQQEGER